MKLVNVGRFPALLVLLQFTATYAASLQQVTTRLQGTTAFEVPRNTTSALRSPASSATPDLDAALKLIQEAQVKQGKLNVHRLKYPLRNHARLRPNRKVQGKHGNFTDTLPVNVRHAVSVASKDYARRKHSRNRPQKRAAFWMESMQHGSVAVGGSSGYSVFRNVKDFGAVGDGVTDDTDAINLAISSGSRCGENCGSSTVKPAIVYFPSGTYLISSPIIQYYNTQIIGNAATPPTIKGSSLFIGLGMISSDVYIPNADGAEWYINQNNFLRQIRNFVIDTTAIPNVMEGQDVAPAGIHWQVAQGTSLQAITINMPTSSDTTHVGIFMENGSGGFMGDVTINGGATGAVFGNQQFTVRNFIFNNCRTAVQMIWDWSFTMKGFTINNCGIGFNALGGADGTGPGKDQGTGSLSIIDTKITNTQTAILATVSGANATSILLDNVQFSGVGVGLDKNGATILGGGSRTITSWATGNFYDNLNADGKGFSQQSGEIPNAWARPAALQGTDGWFQRSKPQYEGVAASGFLNVKSVGAKGDGSTDDTAALNSAFSSAASAGTIVWIPHGIYLISDTVVIPPGSRVVGEIWPQLMAIGANFADQQNPRPMIRVGNPGSTGTAELQDLLFTVRGPTAGAILVEWNIKETTQGGAALWDCHFRVGGAIGSNLQAAQCPKKTGAVNNNCIAATLLLHIKGSGYFENSWVWTADHDLDLISQEQIDVYTGRGVLIESQGPLWLYGTTSEHSVLYQYQIQDSSNVFMGMIQTESPYFQGSPIGAPTPFANGTLPPPPTKRGVDEVTPDEYLEEFFATRAERRELWKRSNPFVTDDPSFGACATDPECTVAWAIRILRSEDVTIYGAGLYSWFQNYDQSCLATNHCQRYLGFVDEVKSNRIAFYNLIGVGATIMMSTTDGISAYARDNKNGFASTVLGFFVTATGSGSVDRLGAPGSLLGPWGQSRRAIIPGDDNGDDVVGATGDALIIVSSSRYADDPVTPGRLEFQQAYEYWILRDGETFGCNDMINGLNALVAAETSFLGGGFVPGGYWPRPIRDVPEHSFHDYDILNHHCHFERDLEGGVKTWDDAYTQDTVGFLYCDEGRRKKIRCLKPPQPDSYFTGWWCAGARYIKTAICYLPLNSNIDPRSPDPSGQLPGSGGNPLLYLERRDLELYPQFFAQTIRRQDLYQPNRQLFYTRRINQQRGQEGLSANAEDFALIRRMQTIWEGWPSRRLDGDAAGHYDFYNVRSSNGFLRNIRQTIFTPGHEDDDNQNFYFRGMSEEFARRARGTVYVMTEDPRNIPEVGIWHYVEFPTLTRAGTPVTEIIAVDPLGYNWWRIWDASDPTVTPANPRRAQPPSKKRHIRKKRGFVPIGGEYIDIGGTSNSDPVSYAAICVNNLKFLFDSRTCPPPAAEMYTRDYEFSPLGHFDLFG